jgi:hypothetical protein
MADPAASRSSLPGLPAAVATLLLAALALTAVSPAWAQRQTFMRGRGSQVNPNTEVVPTNCVTAPDGTVTCDTELRNPRGQTPARPSLDLFEN